jgi:hypothetical protein
MKTNVICRPERGEVFQQALAVTCAAIPQSRERSDRVPGVVVVPGYPVVIEAREKFLESKNALCGDRIASFGVEEAGNGTLKLTHKADESRRCRERPDPSH